MPHHSKVNQTESIHYGNRVNGTELRTDAPIYVYKIHSNRSKRKLIEPFQLNDLRKDKRPLPQRQSNAIIHIIIPDVSLTPALSFVCKRVNYKENHLCTDESERMQCNCLTHYERLNNNQTDWNN